MAFLPALSAGAGILGSLTSGKGAQKAQNQANQNAAAMTAAYQQAINQLGGDATQLMQNYQQNTAPSQQATQKLLQGDLGQTYTNPYAAGAATDASGLSGFNPLSNPYVQAAGGAAGELASNTQGYTSGTDPISQLAQSLITGVNPTTGQQTPIMQALGANSPFQQAQGGAAQLSQFGNPNAQSAAQGLGQFASQGAAPVQSAIQGLMNFNGLSPAQMSNLQTQLGQAGNSTVKTLMGSLGGVANPALLAQSLLGQNEQQALGLTSQLGSQVAQEQLQALQGAGSLGGQQFGQQLGGLESAGNLQLGAGQQQLSGMQSGENAQTNLAGTQLGTLQQSAGQGLQGLTSAGGLGQNGLQSLLQGLSSLGLGATGQQLTGQQAGGNLLSGLSQQNLGYFGDVLNGLLTGYGQQGQMVNSSLSALGGMANSALNGAQQFGQQAASYGNPMQNTLTGITGALQTPGLFGSGTPSPSLNTSGPAFNVNQPGLAGPAAPNLNAINGIGSGAQYTGSYGPFG